MEDAVCGRDRNVVLDKQVDGGIRGTEDELSDLHASQSTLQSVGHADVDSGEGEVGVLHDGQLCNLFQDCCYLPSECG